MTRPMFVPVPDSVDRTDDDLAALVWRTGRKTLTLEISCYGSAEVRCGLSNPPGGTTECASFEAGWAWLQSPGDTLPERVVLPVVPDQWVGEREPTTYWALTQGRADRPRQPTDVPPDVYARLTGPVRTEADGEAHREYQSSAAAVADVIQAAFRAVADLQAPPELIHETQQSIGKWIDETFPGADPATPRKALRVLEELVELCLVSGASAQDVDKAVGKALAKEGAVLGTPAWIARGRRPDKIPAEAADVEIVLRGLAQLHGFDLQAEVDKKMAINRARRWKANGDGTGYHVKEEPWTPKPPPEAPAPSP